jgi:hypothetical protein
MKDNIILDSLSKFLVNMIRVKFEHRKNNGLGNGLRGWFAWWRLKHDGCMTLVRAIHLVKVKVWKEISD